MNYGAYCTRDQLKEALIESKADRASLVKADDDLWRICVRASRSIDTWCRRWFYPFRDVYRFDHPNRYNEIIGEEAVSIDWDLLEVVTFTTDNGNTTMVDGTDYVLKRGQRYNKTPYDTVQILDNADNTFDYSSNRQQANAITGFFGYHEDWPNAWVDSGDDVEDNPLSSTATSVTVNDADGADELGLIPRFSVGQLIRFGTGTSAEYAYITAVDVDGDSLTVVRGVNGTTAASQTQNTDIYIYRPMDDLVRVTIALATYDYKRRSAIGGQDDRPFASASGVMVFGSQLPGEVKGFVGEYKRLI